MRGPPVWALFGVLVSIGVTACAGILGIDQPAPIQSADASDVDASASVYATTVLADRPLLYYRLGETSGTVAHDLGSVQVSGLYGDRVRLGAPSLVRGDPDPSALFLSKANGGTAAIVTVPQTPALEPRTGLTIECWILATNYVDSARVISYGSDDSADAFEAWILQIAGNRLEFYSGALKVDAPYNVVASGQAFSTGPNPYHIAATFDGTTITLYVNGQNVRSMPATGQLGRYDTVHGLGIGGGFSGGGGQVVGTIDEVAVYDRDLGADRIMAHYSAGK